MINQETIKNQINALIDQTKVLEQQDSQQAFADGLATIIVAALASAQVTIAPGSIITTGSATTQSNPSVVTGNLN